MYFEIITPKLNGRYLVGWIENWCKVSFYKKNPTDQGLDSTNFIELWTQWSYIIAMNNSVLIVMSF